MKSIFFDTETTGLRPGQIGQLTYIVEENNQFVKCRNLFFTVDMMEAGAEKVHGFSMELLQTLSEGKRFEDHLEEIRGDFKDGIVIAHNVNFDLKFMAAEFARLGITFEYKKPFCTMEYFKDIAMIPARNGVGFKNPKLEEVVKHFDLERESILAATKKLFKCDNVSYHDARYDTTAMYICCLMSRGREEVFDLLEEDEQLSFM